MDNVTVYAKVDILNVYVAYVIGFFYVITSIVGFIGNSLTILAILKNKYLQTPMNICLASLALCDLIACLIVLPVRLSLYTNNSNVSFTPMLCRVDVFLKSVFDYVQPFMLVATSFERYKSIAKPFQSKDKIQRTRFLIVIMWSACLCLAIISAIFFHDAATYFPCSQHFYSHVQFSILHFREGYVKFPLGLSCLVIVCVFYFLMIRTLGNHARKMKKGRKPERFNNKVGPESISNAKNDKRAKVDTLNIHKICVENNESNTSDHSRPPTRTSFLPSDIVKSSTECLENSKQHNENDKRTSGQTKEIKTETITHTDYQTASNELDDRKSKRNEEEEQRTSHQRRLSFRKARDVIYLPSNESRNSRKFSAVAQQVVLLRTHKRKSLINMQRKVFSGSQCDKDNSMKMNTCEESEFEEIQDKQTTENTCSCSTDGNLTSVIKRSTEVISSQGNLKMPSLAEVPAMASTEHKFERSDSCIQNIVRKSSKNSMEAVSSESQMHMMLSIDSDGADKLQTSIILDDKDNKETLCNASKSELNQSSELNPSVSGKCSDISSQINTDLNNAATTSAPEFSESLCVQKENPKDHAVAVNAENSNTSGAKKQTGIVETQNSLEVKTIDEKKRNFSNVDIVDFDGTVHKAVAVEGAVVGAVCVMNTSNKLEGRRKVEMRAAKRIAVIIGSFVLLWLPLPLIALFVSSRKQISSRDVEALLVLASIGSMTAAVNPILNLLLNKQLRSATTTILRRIVNSLKRKLLR